MARAWRLSEEFERAGFSRTRAYTQDAPAHGGTAAPDQSDTRGGGEAWLHRHRREMAAVWPILILAAVSELGHVSAPEWALLPFPCGVLAALALATWGTRPVHRWGVPVLALGGLWVTASWWRGIDDPVVLASLALLGGTTVAGWWRYQHPRSRIEVVGGSPWPWDGEAHRFHRRARRELGNVLQVWPWIAELIGTPGAHLRRPVADIEDGYELHVDLPRGKLGKHIKTDVLASALREFPVDIVTPDPSKPWEIVLRQRLEPVNDELHGEGAADPDVEEDAEAEPAKGGEAPAAVNVADIRLQMLLSVYRSAGKPLSDRRAASRSNLPRDWVWRVGRPALAEREQLVQDGDRWVARAEEGVA